MAQPAQDWTSPQDNHALTTGEVHVWRARLDLPPGVRAGLYEFLNDTQRAQAERLRVNRDRFICAEGILRDILARYAEVDPRSLAYQKGPHGKPYLGDYPWLRFNLTHSHDLALVAVTREREVGVDVERIDPTRPMRRLADRFFSQQEREALHAVPDDQIAEAFYACWTRKEAYLKARGTGLTFGTRRFTVSVDAPALLHVDNEPEEPARWTLTDLQAAPNYRATLTTEGPLHSLQTYQWLP